MKFGILDDTRDNFLNDNTTERLASASKCPRIPLDGLTFDDVCIRPERTNVRPDDVSLRSEIFRGLYTSLPILSAPMQSVWSKGLLLALGKAGGMAVVDRDLTIKEIKDLFGSVSEMSNGTTTTLTVAASPFDSEKIKWLLGQKQTSHIILDSVQPFNDTVIETVKRYAFEYPNKIVLGNIATGEAAEEFLKYPIAALKVGLGPGSICTTREITGVGVPQLQAISEISNLAKRKNVPVIADGGIRTSGDAAKALAAGASSIMLGKLFAATSESGSRTTVYEGREYKAYAGSRYASVEFNESTGDRDLDESLKCLANQNHRVEGVSGLLPIIGSVEALTFQFQRALSASFAFVGAKNLEEFQNRARFIKVSPASAVEGRAHGIQLLTEKNRFF